MHKNIFKMIEVKNKGNIKDYVYDISLDGTVVNALGGNLLSNTDGFNFQMPEKDKFRYTDEHPYISNGKGRNSIEGKSYTGVNADVAEFEDMYLCEPYTTGINKMGLGIDEFCDACIQFARKNYADLMPDGSIKLVGNTIKSKKMPIYIEKFINKGINLLLHGKGKEFLENYYDYIEKIYNMQIPLKDIASVGKIKTSIETYKESCKQLTAGGTKKARQAWYELAIKDNISVNMGDAIYYINIGKKKTSSDVQRLTKYFYMENGEKIDYVIDENGNKKLDKKGNVIELTKELDRQYTKFKKENKDNKTELSKYKNLFEYGKSKYPKLEEEDVLVFSCVRLSNEIVEDEDDHFCDDSFEYNKDKYIDMFNKRIRPLLVCFDKSIRIAVNEKGKEIDNILITDPKDRKTFTEEESKLVAGQPYNVTDQDTYIQLMTMEDKEIKFWTSVNKVPPYVEQCGMNWSEIKNDYLNRMKELESEGIKNEVDEYNKIIASLKQSDLDALVDDGVLPDKLLNLVYEDVNSNSFITKKYNVKLGTIFDILDKDYSINTNIYENEE